MDPQELVPLEAGDPRPLRIPAHPKRNCYLAPRSCYIVPFKLCRLLVMLIVLPSLFIFIPLYLRYRVFSGQMYPMSMTDMRLIDSKISTTWCQRQVVRSNATFNAFVVPGPPVLQQDLVQVSMTRELELGDDMKEYWGFYLLKGSSVTVSTCVRHPGASLIMIKGYKHLQECAYIGDDSSEEVEELMEAYGLGLITNSTLMEKIQNLTRDQGKANKPDAMQRYKPGVSFHDPNKAANTLPSTGDKENLFDVADPEHDPKELREILERLHALREAAKNQHFKNYHLPSNLMALPALHTGPRDANVNRNERKWLFFEDIDGNNTKAAEAIRASKEVKTTTATSIESEKANSTETTTDADEKPQEVVEDNNNKRLNVTAEISNESIATQDEEVEELHEVTTKYTAPSSSNESEEPNSREVFEDVLHRLQALGDRGKRVLIKLHQTMGVDYHEKTAPAKTKADIMSVVTGSDEELDRLRRVLVEAIDEEKTKSQRRKKRREAMEQARSKRETLLGQIELQKSFNEDDKDGNDAAEEIFTQNPDGYADHHVQLNESTPLDMSNSEFWSSFSSSEEALLECEGLILNLPLTPHSTCVQNATENLSAAKANALTYSSEEALLECEGLVLIIPLTQCRMALITYLLLNLTLLHKGRVPANGYYFFVFSSENEVKKNFIRARFELQKTRYDVARTALRECTNSTERCDLNLDLFTTQKVVLEVPLRNNDSLWNEQFVIISECEPRTSIYMFCVIAVPVLIIIFAFQ